MKGRKAPCGTRPLPSSPAILLPRKAESCAFNCAQHVQHVPWVTSRQQPPLVKETSPPFGWSLDRVQVPAIWWRVAGRLHQGESFLQGRPAASKIDSPSWFCNDSGNSTAQGFFSVHSMSPLRFSLGPSKREVRAGFQSRLPYCGPPSAVWLRGSCFTSLSPGFLISQMGAILPNWQGCGEHGISQSFENWASQHVLLLFPSAYPSISSSKELEFQSASSWIQKHPVDSGTMSCPQLQKHPALGPRSQLGGRGPGLHSCLFPLLAFRI